MVTKQRYPLSTINGDVIPLDVLRPSGVLRVDFVAGTPTAVAQLPAGTELLMIRASAPCIVRFDGTQAAALSSTVQPDTLYLEENEVQVVSPPSLDFSILGEVLDGKVYLQVLETWQGLGLEIGYIRK